MPTLSARYPSFQLALLTPMLRAAGFPVKPYSLFIYFGHRVGWRVNEVLGEVWPCMVGEWLWSRAAFGPFSDDDAYLARYERNLAELCRRAGITLPELVTLRNEATEEFLDWTLRTIDFSQFSAVGFSVVFQQQCATLALARRIKERLPGLPVIVGGASMEDDIAGELMERCPQLDVAHCGDAEDTLPELLRRLEEGRPLEGLPGVMHRVDGRVRYAGRAPNLEDMRRTPVPDYDEYFHARRETGLPRHEAGEEVMLPVETSRGCWWGQKNHCTFCGLNRAGMDYRSKPVEQSLEMLDTLARRHGHFHYFAIDNILEPAYVDGLFGALAERRTDLRLHYEVRPSLGRAQLRAMRRGGLFSVQPGIESFSTRVLRLMRKMTTGMRNVEFTKWCTYYGITNLYNILLGFKGETPEDYAQQVEVIRRIPHFQPPYAITRARADRGSPMFTDPELHGIGALRPSACYAHIFPDAFDRRRVSYYFEQDMTGTCTDEEYDGIFAAVNAWQDRWKDPGTRPTLVARVSHDTLFIDDARTARPVRYVLGPRMLRLHDVLHDAHTRAALGEALPDFPAGEVDELLNELLARDLVLHLDGKYLALSLPANPDH